jgi:hypothetical protein
VDITSNTFYKCTATFRTQCINGKTFYVAVVKWGSEQTPMCYNCKKNTVKQRYPVLQTTFCWQCNCKIPYTIHSMQPAEQTLKLHIWTWQAQACPCQTTQFLKRICSRRITAVSDFNLKIFRLFQEFDVPPMSDNRIYCSWFVSKNFGWVYIWFFNISWTFGHQ